MTIFSSNKKTQSAFYIPLILFLCTSFLSAQTEFIKDVYIDGAGSDPASITHINGDLVFFVGSSYDEIRQPYATDGTSEGTVTLLNSEEQDGSPWFIDYPIRFNNKVYFVAQSELYGTEVYVSNGTPAGSGLLKDINPGDYYSDADNLTVFSGRLFFAASNGDPHDRDNNGSEAIGKELWVSDGTKSGTILFKDIYEGTYTNNYNQEEAHDSNPDYLTVVGDQMFFSARTANTGYELWVTDGTQEGTNMVKDIYTGLDTNDNPESSDPQDLYAFDSKVLFVAEDAEHGSELWISDGSESGTLLLKDFDGTENNGLNSFNDPVTLNGLVYFEYDNQLWSTDGTTDGTLKILDLPSDVEGELLKFENQLVLKGSTSLWLLGTESSTLEELTLTGLTGFDELTVYNDLLYFSANSTSTFTGTETGNELFVTDGTEAGTMLVRDLYPGVRSGLPNDSRPEELTVAGDLLYFSAENEEHGRELWYSNGLPERIRIIDHTNIQDIDIDEFDIKISFSDIDTTIKITVLRDTMPGADSLSLPEGYNLAKPGLWRISQDTSATFTADIYFNLDDLPDSGFDLSDLRILKRENASSDWAELTTVVEEIDGEDMVVTSDITSFSEFVIAEKQNATSITENIPRKEDFRLLPAYPNPFNPSTTLSYQLPEATEVELAIYDIQGRQVAMLVNGTQSKGNYKVKFDASNLASGIYIYQLKTQNFTRSRSVTLIK